MSDQSTPARDNPQLLARFWKKVNKEGPLPEDRPELGRCWQWTAFLDKAGYGRLHGGGRKVPVLHAHVLSYELANGPVPPSLELDHLCRNRGCCNPAHLEAVTHRVNAMRGKAPTVLIALTGRCNRGHEINSENCYYRKDRPGKWNCNACRRSRRAAARANRKAVHGDGG